MWMLYKEIEKETIMTTEEKCNTQLEQQQQQQQRTTRRNANTVESNICRSNVEHLTKHAKMWEKESPGELLQFKNN